MHNRGDGIAMKKIAFLAGMVALVSTQIDAQTYTSFTPASAPASSNKSVTSAITAPNSTSAFKMQGLGASITPNASGTVLVTVTGTVICHTGTTATLGAQYQIALGSGTSLPASNSVASGTIISGVAQYRNGVAMTAAADVQKPFMITGLATGLTVGNPYWIDVQAKSVTTANAIGFQNVNVSAVEQVP